MESGALIAQRLFPLLVVADLSVPGDLYLVEDSVEQKPVDQIASR